MRPLARILCVAICGVVLVCHAVAADAQSQVSILIGTTPGGGYDIYARALARHISRHLPGRPTVIAKTVPGAGGLSLANYMYNRAPADGSELATVQNGLPFEKLFQTLSPDGRNALFDATKFGWVGSITQTVLVSMTRCQSAGVCSSSRPDAPMPAHATSLSGAPFSPTVCSIPSSRSCTAIPGPPRSISRWRTAKSRARLGRIGPR
jgi:hypothetical protein